MRVLIDANVLISYLLAAKDERIISTIVEAAVNGRFILVTTPRLLEELAARVTNKRYLAAWINHEALPELLALLTEISEPAPELSHPIPPVSRDPKDDYLLAAAALGQVDYLVTGDTDLLVLGTIEALQIIRPREFVVLLRSGDLS